MSACTVRKADLLAINPKGVAKAKNRRMDFSHSTGANRFCWRSNAGKRARRQDPLEQPPHG